MRADGRPGLAGFSLLINSWLCGRWPEFTEAGLTPAQVWAKDVEAVSCRGEGAGAEQKLALKVEEAASFIPCPLLAVIFLFLPMSKSLLDRKVPGAILLDSSD